MNFEESSSIGGALLTPGDHLLNLRLLLFCELRPSTGDPSFLPGGIRLVKHLIRFLKLGGLDRNKTDLAACVMRLRSHGGMQKGLRVGF
jgi:hypothetical protein